MTDEQIREIAEGHSKRMGLNVTDVTAQKLTSAIRILDAAGFAIVPKEPTEAMMREGALLPTPWNAEQCGAIYLAMLRASRKDVPNDRKA